MDEWYVFEYTGTSGERCDVAVTLQLRELSEFTELSRARVQALIDQGGVLYDGKDVPRAQKNLRMGMRIQVNLTLLRALLHPPAPTDVEPLNLPLNFLHVDEQLAVVDKPAGLTVHPAATEDGPTLTAALLHHLGKLSAAGGADRPGIVHRLDKETSGLLVVARDNPTHVALSRQFARREVQKEYAALCIDEPEPPSGTVDSPIERHPRHRQRMWAEGIGRPALTEYCLTARWGPFALIDVVTHTGRTHQIRVHLLSVGTCILNDEKYGEGRNRALRKFLHGGKDNSARRAWREALPVAEVRAQLADVLATYPGIFLHARRLAFTHPGTGEHVEFLAQPPQEWQLVRQLCC